MEREKERGKRESERKTESNTDTDTRGKNGENAFLFTVASVDKRKCDL